MADKGVEGRGRVAGKDVKVNRYWDGENAGFGTGRGGERREWCGGRGTVKVRGRNL